MPDGDGWRAHGRTMGSTAAARKGRIGFDYVHSLVDDDSRLAHAEVLPDEKGPTCGALSQRAAQYFAEHGITGIEAVTTDNHWSYSRSVDVAAVLAALDTRHVFIRPHSPWHCGKGDRFSRTLQSEWAYRQVFTGNTQRAQALAPGSTSTTVSDATQPSEATLRSAD